MPTHDCALRLRFISGYDYIRHLQLWIKLKAGIRHEYESFRVTVQYGILPCYLWVQFNWTLYILPPT